MTGKRIGILVVAYNAATTLATVLDRIPAEFRDSVTTIIIGDDHSQDQTHLVAMGYQQLWPDMPLQIIRHQENLGYGGNQKWGYRTAIAQDLDVIVLLHGDGQYAPELLPEMVAPLIADEADAVFGSRMMVEGGARRGGMPMYKYIGNRILTTVENAVAGVELTEWHSGYRAYSVQALRQLPFESNSDGFDFDTQIIIQLIESQQRIAEIPIPTYYGDEISHVNGLKYAKDIVGEVLRYRAHKMGFGTGELAFASSAYEQKEDDESSHRVLSRWLGRRSAARILDLGCSDGAFAQHLVDQGHHVTGVDLVPHEHVKERVDEFVQADLDRGLPPEVSGPYDVVLAADVLEHLRDPGALLEQLRGVLAPGGSVIASVPNFGHWYPRTRVALGRFDYDRRGILDAGHVRFFTRRSIERLVHTSGYSVVRRETTGLPIEVADRGGHGDEVAASGPSRLVGRLDRIAVQLRPQLFGYQFLFELRPDATAPPVDHPA